MSTPSKFLARHATLKQRAVAPAYRAMARTNVFYPPPRVVANGFPKAGTHLLAMLMHHLPRMMYSGLHRSAYDFVPAGGELEAIDSDRLTKTLGGVRHGQYMTAHFPMVPEISRALSDLDFAHVLVLRDPRDVAVSTVAYVSSLPSHDLYTRFTSQITRPEDQLLAAINGFADDEFGRGLAPIGVRLERYLGWVSDPAVLVVRFEDLIGPAGGGSVATQVEAVRAVARHVRRPLSDQSAQRLADRVWSPKSSTFNAGQQGGWQTRFTDEHREAFKIAGGAQLVKLGYEDGPDW